MKLTFLFAWVFYLVSAKPPQPNYASDQEFAIFIGSDAVRIHELSQQYEPIQEPTQFPTSAAPTTLFPATSFPTSAAPTTLFPATSFPTSVATQKPSRSNDTAKSGKSGSRVKINTEHITIIVCVISGFAGFFGCSYYYYSLEKKRQQKITELEHEIEGQNHVFDYPDGTIPALFSQESPRFARPRSDEAILINKSSPRWSIFSSSVPPKTIDLSSTNSRISSTKVSTLI